MLFFKGFGNTFYTVWEGFDDKANDENTENNNCPLRWNGKRKED